MDPLTMFVPLAKADAAQRLVYGYFDETPDRAGEVCDYATAKPAFEAWSASLEKASGGKSLGNIRGQHSNIAAGKLIEITFDDMAKQIGFVAKIVDDNEWKKVDEGVYTGFSPGGKYAKRWQDGLHKRYTPDVRELSIVDVPCNPSAIFTMVKADGTEETREFVLAKAYEPGNEATRERSETLAKVAGGVAKDFVVKARAELIAENADEALAKMAEEPKADPVAKLDAVLAKAAVAAKSKVATLDVPEQFSDFSKAAAALKLLTSDAPLAKGLYTIGWLARLMEEFASLQGALAIEAGLEGDGSAQPAKAAEIVKAIGELLVGMAQEEVAEACAALSGGDVEVTPIDDTGTMELAQSIVDLVKSDSGLMEKAGARNSKADQAKIQTMHDHSVSLGANCDADANKDALSALEADRDRLAKAFDAAIPKVEALAATLETVMADREKDRGELAKALGEIETLKAQPMPPKGVLRTLEKGEEGGPLVDDKPAPLTGDALVREARRTANTIR